MTDDVDLKLRVASLLQEVAEGRTDASDAVACADRWTDIPWATRCFAEAYHLLKHFEEDTDIRQRDPEYAQEQVSALRSLADELRQ